MDEYPNSDEEFELMYGDEFELLKEQEDPEISTNTARKTLNFNTNPKDTTNNHDKSLELDFTTLESNENRAPNSQSSQTDSSIRKRTIEELFGDIDDILFESQGAPKRHKGEDEKAEDLALIEQIVEMRRKARERDLTQAVKRDYTENFTNRDKNNLSYTVPKYPFIGVTRNDGVRIYVRFHSESYEREESLRITHEITHKGLLGNSKDIWTQAQQLINKQLEDTSSSQIIEDETDTNKSLWVDLYKPRKYVELLSDESTNRIMLKWLKLWDKVVFKRNPPVKIAKSEPDNKFKKFDLDTELDEHGRPKLKIALLCGPPGLGKTTLAHMVARHCGYNVVEINASDDRSIEVFKTCLENATQMRSLLDKEKRPNCIIFDEIDGAPASSIDFLIKFVQGGVRSKKKGDKGTNQILKRPIICICNDVYVPALRPLRQISFVINFPPTSNTRLAERLMEIARRERIKTDTGAMLALAQKSHNDIRSCLSVLHFFKSENKAVNLSDIYKASVGQKDMQKGLFSVWQDIFLISSSNSKTHNPSLKERMNNTLSIVNSFGDYERVAQGVFENFPKLDYKSLNLDGTCIALEWFCFNDILNRQIYSLQNYSLSCYLPYAFVVWHFTFASRNWQKLQYPSAGYEAKMKQTRQKAIIAEMLRGMQPNVRAYIQPISLILDIIPLIRSIITPNFRPISLHLYTKEERQILEHVVSVMVDYNLNYIQERTAEGSYDYKLDPNIDEIVSFGSKYNLSYSNKQLIAKEIETLKMHRFEKQQEDSSTLSKVHDKNGLRSCAEANVPNHLQTLRAKSVSSVEMPAVTKDFFGRIIPKTSPKGLGKGGLELKNDIWFQFKEGYSNAVRKKVKVASLK